MLINGRPQNSYNRLPQEQRVYDLFDQLGLEYIVVDHAPAMTMNDIVDVEKKLDVKICKNLFLVNSNKSQYYLCMLPGHKKFKTKEISKQIQSSRLSFAGDDKMKEYLDITPGSVSIMGLMNDHEHRVFLLVDEDILQNEFIGFHPCINTSSIKMKTKDLFDKVLIAIDHEYQIIHC